MEVIMSIKKDLVGVAKELTKVASHMESVSRRDYRFTTYSKFKKRITTTDVIIIKRRVGLIKNKLGIPRGE